jgi:hypothetical protein
MEGDVVQYGAGGILGALALLAVNFFRSRVAPAPKPAPKPADPAPDPSGLSPLALEIARLLDGFLQRQRQEETAAKAAPLLEKVLDALRTKSGSVFDPRN